MDSDYTTQVSIDIITEELDATTQVSIDIITEELDATTQGSIDIITKKLKQHKPQSGCTIYRVHTHLREVNDKAYEPNIIAIGPYHHDKDHLKMFQEHKLHYFHLLLQRTNGNVETYVSAIVELEEEARKCYAEHVSLNKTEFIEMMVLDGCFIIELVRKFRKVPLREENDPIFNMNWIVNSLQRDLMLFENQIPFFILRKLFDLIKEADQHDDSLMDLVFCFFKDLYPGEVIREISHQSPGEIKHLLHLIHDKWIPSPSLPNLGDDRKDTTTKLQFIKYATGLKEAHVKFKRNKDKPLFDVSFKNGTLFLPLLTIEDRTESLFRNLIAYEQYFPDIQCRFVTDYVKFMGCLIDSSRDVEILSHFGIINNWSGDDQVVANMFNKLTDSVTCPGKSFVYAKLYDSLNVHCVKRKIRWIARLRRNYWNSPWAVISILVAVILLSLTVTQTVFTILQVVLHPKESH